MKSINCRISKVYAKEDEILMIEIKEDAHFKLEDFMELKQAALKLGNGKRYYNLIKVGAHTIPDKEAREASCSIEGSYYKKADAFVISTLSQKIIARLMMKLNKPAVPTQFFYSEKEALTWLKNLRQQELKLVI